jgi:hypothetical protein
MEIKSNSNILAKTRAEEHDDDVWGEFYFPPYFDELELKTATKSSYIVGKRGCGKTMLLKYLDYRTAFSSKREQIPDDEINHLGIYWRIDTQFCNALKLRNIEEESWISIFENYFALVIATQIIRAVRTVSISKFKLFGKDDFSRLTFPSAKDFHPDFPTAPDELERYLEGRRRLFSTWISNMSCVPQPLLPPGMTFLDALVGDIKKMPELAVCSFYIYVDEVENLVPYQRRVLNAFLKHSQKPIIVSFTSKVLSDENRTTGPESVNATHDYMKRDLNELLPESDGKVFFAEVYLSNFDIAMGHPETEFLKCVLDPEKIKYRQSTDHKSSVLKRIEDKFPSKTLKAFALDALVEPRTNRIFREQIDKALANRTTILTFESFWEYANYADALLVVPALLNRKTQTPENVLAELVLFSKSQTSAFKTSWIHNNLFAALLELYRPYASMGSICPLYSGFDAFFTMAGNNLRHFLILGYKALEIARLNEEDEAVFSIETQANAAFLASNQLISEIKTFGELGEKLKLFVLRLGRIFRILQANLALSESEQNHFTINAGSRSKSSDEVKLLSEATKHGILIEQSETKTKDIGGSDTVDYQLNPIYAAYFQISYRRKRKIELSIEQFSMLALGSEDEYTDLTKQFYKSGTVMPKSNQLGFWE